MKKILKIGTPLITSYPMIANRFSILGVEPIKAKKYLCNNYINLIAISSWNNEENYSSSFIDTYLDSFYQKCPFLKYSGILRYTVQRKYKDLSDYIEEEIGHNNYLYLILNNYFLSCSPSYRNEHRMHDTLIYGYDKEKQIVMISDFYNYKYVNTTVSYDEINDGFKYYFYDNDYRGKQMGEIISIIKLMDFPNGLDYDINIEEIYQKTEDYVNSSNSYPIMLEDVFYKNRVKKYGLDYYDILNKNFNSEQILDHRWIYVLLDHKRAWNIRLNYLVEKGYIKSNRYPKIMDECNELYHFTKVILYLILKCNINRDNELKLNIVKKCEELKNKDYQFMKDILSLL